MKRLSTRAWVSVAVALVVLAVINSLLSPDGQLERSRTTHGKGLAGFGAVFDLMEALEQSPSRSLQRYGRVEPDRPLWLMAPNWGSPKRRAGASSDSAETPGAPSEQGAERRAARSDSPDADAASRDSLDSDPGPALRKELEAWVEAGGTAVVFAGHERDLQHLRETVELPDSESLHASGVLSEGSEVRVLPLESEALRGFSTSDEVSGRVLLSAGAGVPLAIEWPLGRGLLVAVSDARLLDNEHLARAQYALLASDLVRAYGAPRFDERCHGLSPPRSFWRALGARRGLLLFGLFFGTVVLWLWSRGSVPAQKLAPASELDASLGRFVESLSLLYGRHASSHPQEVYEAYRHGWAHRQGASGVRTGGSRSAAAPERAGSLVRAALAGGGSQAAPPPRTTAELVAAVRSLERQVRVASRRPGMHKAKS